MVTSKAERRHARTPRATEDFGQNAEAALDALALMDYAWHDCYGESSPSKQVTDDIWEVSDGDLALLIAAAHLAVVDFRDLRMWADKHREGG